MSNSCEERSEGENESRDQATNRIQKSRPYTSSAEEVEEKEDTVLLG